MRCCTIRTCIQPGWRGRGLADGAGMRTHAATHKKKCGQLSAANWAPPCPAGSFCLPTYPLWPLAPTHPRTVSVRRGPLSQAPLEVRAECCLAASDTTSERSKLPTACTTRCRGVGGSGCSVAASDGCQPLRSRLCVLSCMLSHSTVHRHPPTHLCCQVLHLLRSQEVANQQYMGRRPREDRGVGVLGGAVKDLLGEGSDDDLRDL